MSLAFETFGTGVDWIGFESRVVRLFTQKKTRKSWYRKTFGFPKKNKLCNTRTLLFIVDDQNKTII